MALAVRKPGSPKVLVLLSPGSPGPALPLTSCVATCGSSNHPEPQLSLILKERQRSLLPPLCAVVKLAVGGCFDG